jgi:3-methyladenine DNA glycosylase AlkD
LGITVPVLRSIAAQYNHTPQTDIALLLKHPIHEARLLALLILVTQYQKADLQEQKRIVTFYLRNRHRVNNWDLVDSSAHQILGESLRKERDRSILSSTLVMEQNLWANRIAIVSTYAFIRQGEFQPTIEIATALLTHPHDLMHKAVGWMLREVGKRDCSVLMQFIERHGISMPRTMLRYAIERLPERERRRILAATK